MNSKQYSTCASLLTVLVAFTSVPSVHAASIPAELDPTKSFSFDCVTSAYYSPERSQSYYQTGDYWRDIYLNGNGTNGADGTQVALGMLAAPPSIPFGTKIYVEGFGLGTVHDRGGAIRGDRIDIYMGSGDAGLARAINWGKRTTKCVAYPDGVAIPEDQQATEGNFKLPSEEMPARIKAAIEQNLRIGNTGDKVKELQQKLKDLGFYKGEVDGDFDEETEQAVIGYQISEEIVTASDGYGAGYVGPATWNELFAPPIPQVTYGPQPITKSTTPKTLTIGATGASVTALQEKLKELGYYTYPLITGNYGPKTAEAVGAFQLQYGIVSSAEDPNYGLFGSKTARILDKVTRGEEVTPGDLIDIDFAYTLKRGMRNDEVEKLQKKLAQAGFYSYPEYTGLYGQVTEDAVFAFQASQDLVRSKEDVGAGVYGPITARTLDIFLNDRIYLNPEVVQLSNPYRMDQVLTSVSGTSYGGMAMRYEFKNDLDYGSRGEDVTQLQLRLGLAPSGVYDVETKQAVCAFQIEVQLISSCTERRAGVFGETTRAEMNAR